VLCERPALSDPETATDNDFAGDFLKMDEALTVCARRHEDLVKFERGGNTRS